MYHLYVVVGMHIYTVLMQMEDIHNTMEASFYFPWLIILPRSCQPVHNGLPSQNRFEQFNSFAMLLSSGSSLTASRGLRSLKTSSSPNMSINCCISKYLQTVKHTLSEIMATSLFYIGMWQQSPMKLQQQ